MNEENIYQHKCLTCGELFSAKGKFAFECGSCLHERLTKELEKPFIEVGEFNKETFQEMVDYMSSGEYDRMIGETRRKEPIICMTREWYRNNKQFCLDTGMSEEEWESRFGEEG